VKYQLTDEAARDVEEILAYSVNSFGVVQTEHYFEALKECIELLADNPYIGTALKKSCLNIYASLTKVMSFSIKTFRINSCGEDSS
jgi:plasmid stabilization system protein ParE